MSNQKIKMGVLAALVGIVALLSWNFADRLSFHYLADQELTLREYVHANPVWMVLGAFFAYVIVAGLSIPGAMVMTLSIGWLYGFWLGLLIVSFGSTAGATLAFLLTRYFFRELIQQRFADRLRIVNEAFDREGAFYLFSLRLIPAVPFFVINAVMGLTRIHVFTFWWVSQIGMVPATIAYVYAGASVPSLQVLQEKGVGGLVSSQLILALAVLGILPLLLKRLNSKLRFNRQLPNASSEHPTRDP